MAALTELKKKSTEITAISQVLSLMQWDQEVIMPGRAAADRASQFAVLSGLVHRLLVAPELGDILRVLQGKKLSVASRALVRVITRERDQHVKQPEEFVCEFARLTSQAQTIWQRARQRDDFALFLPYLEKIVTMSRQRTEYLGYETEPYDALLDLHEEGLRTVDVDRLFAELAPHLITMLQNLTAHAPLLPAVTWTFDRNAQIAFAEKLLATIGYDFHRGRQDPSAHPFSTSIGHDDRRVTNRYHPNSLEFIFSALHEGGHALYEQGIARRFANTHLDNGVSLGIHESQSRLWENIIGRGKPFWEYLYPELQEAFPAQFSNTALADFLTTINAVRPGPIRVEADEVSYNLHILIRFELEKGLLSGAIQARDLPALWREKYENYLGITGQTDADGVLQDIHWAHGSFGYFPTYTIGNLAAAQFWSALRRDNPDCRQALAVGDFGRLRQWLASRIYQHGAVYQPAELIRQVTGEELSSRYFLRYLDRKYIDAVPCSS